MKIYGIDFGTTNSCVTCYDSTKLKNFDKNQIKIKQSPLKQKQTFPTMILFDPFSPNIYFSEEAENVQKESKINSIINWKILLGKKFIHSEFQKYQSFFLQKNIELVNENNILKIKIHHNNQIKYVTAEYLTCLFFQYIKQNYLQDYHEQDLVVVTIPAHFNEDARNQIKTACEKNLINLTRIINEPTSTALLNIKFDEKKDNEVLVVFDCGGGTTDISLVEINYKDQEFNVIEVLGDNQLGGENMTNQLVEQIINQYSIKNTEKYKQLIKQNVEEMKKSLSNEQNKNFTMYLDCIPVLNQKNEEKIQDLKITTSQQKFLDMTNEFWKKIENMIIQFIKQTRNSGKFISNIILTGGSTKHYYFKKLMTKHFNYVKKIYAIENPDTSISFGAAIMGCNIFYSKFTEQDDDFTNFLIQDIIPFTIGLEMDSHLIDVLIPKNTKLPFENKKYYTNSQKNITFIDFNIYQGESLLSYNNLHIGTLRVNGLNPKSDEGQIRFLIKIYIDTSGCIEFYVKNFQSNVEQQITLNKVDLQKKEDQQDLFYEQIKFEESILANKLKERNLYLKKFQDLLSIYKDRIEEQEKKKTNDLTQSFVVFRFDQLFNKHLNILDNYLKYSNQELRDQKKKLEEDWHKNMFYINQQEYGSSKIEE